MVSEIDLKDPKTKRIINTVRKKLLGDEEGVKRYILYSSDPSSKNFRLFKDFSNKLDFELPTTGEKFATVESSFEMNGIETYVCQRDRHDAMKFQLITELAKNQVNEKGIEVIPTGVIRKLIESAEETKSKKQKVIPRQFIEELLKKNKKVIDIKELKKLLIQHEEKQPFKPNIPLSRIPMSEVRKAEEETEKLIKIQEKLRTPSELYAIHHSTVWRAKYPVPKLNFTASMYMILTNVITGLIVWFVAFSVFGGD